VLRVSRPFWYFVLGDLSAWALALGPAMAVALVRLRGWPGGSGWWRRSGTRRGHGLALLVAGGVAAALLADLSGMSEAEVERIWLPFGAWVLLAGASLAGRRARPWLALQAASAVVLVALVTTQW
jgi:methylthioxylose transferase